jgi:hypothetical protein
VSAILAGETGLLGVAQRGELPVLDIGAIAIYRQLLARFPGFELSTIRNIISVGLDKRCDASLLEHKRDNEEYSCHSYMTIFSLQCGSAI